MMGGAIGQAVAQLAWSFLRWYLERSEIRNDERRQIALEALERIKLALEWKNQNPIDPNGDIRDDFKLRDKRAEIERIRDNDT